MPTARQCKSAPVSASPCSPFTHATSRPCASRPTRQCTGSRNQVRTRSRLPGRAKLQVRRCCFGNGATRLLATRGKSAVVRRRLVGRFLTVGTRDHFGGWPQCGRRSYSHCRPQPVAYPSKRYVGNEPRAAIAFCSRIWPETVSTYSLRSAHAPANVALAATTRNAPAG